jgi:hypothetical protein
VCVGHMSWCPLHFEMPMLGSCQLQNFKSHLSTTHLFRVVNLSCVSLLVKC